MSKKIKLTEDQIKALKDLWFIYGNGRKHSTLFNHKLIQGFTECGEDRREDYAHLYETAEHDREYPPKTLITEDCLKEIEKIVGP